jgi:hypothetical protein
MGAIRVAKYRHPNKTYGLFWIAYCRTHRTIIKRKTLFGSVTGGHPSWNAAIHAALVHHLEEH